MTFNHSHKGSSPLDLIKYIGLKVNGRPLQVVKVDRLKPKNE